MSHVFEFFHIEFAGTEGRHFINLEIVILARVPQIGERALLDEVAERVGVAGLGGIESGELFAFLSSGATVP